MLRCRRRVSWLHVICIHDGKRGHQRPDTDRVSLSGSGLSSELRGRDLEWKGKAREDKGKTTDLPSQARDMHHLVSGSETRAAAIHEFSRTRPVSYRDSGHFQLGLRPTPRRLLS